MRRLVAILAIVLILGIYLVDVEFFRKGERADFLHPLQVRTSTNEEAKKPVERLSSPKQRKVKQTEMETVQKGVKKPAKPLTDSTTLRVADAIRVVSSGEEQRYMEARKVLTDALLEGKQGGQREKIKAVLDKLNKKMIFSRFPTKDSEIYVVKPGDSLWRIAKKYGTTPGMVKMVNQKSRDMIRIGDRLKILKGKMKLLVDYSDFTLTVLLNGHYVKQYKIGIGRYVGKRPTGKFIIETKKERPTWYAPDGNIYPYGHPKNVLGTRWLGFKETALWAGYGIHGTADATSIGKASSEGCIRLLNKDVEELFEMIPRGTEVEIRD